MNKQTRTDNTDQHSAPSAPEQAKARRRYGYGLGHFLKSKPNYSRSVEKERNHSFELGYN